MISFHIVNYLHNRAVFFWHTIQNKRIAMFDDWIPLPVRMVFGWEIIEYRMRRDWSEFPMYQVKQVS